MWTLCAKCSVSQGISLKHTTHGVTRQNNDTDKALLLIAVHRNKGNMDMGVTLRCWVCMCMSFSHMDQHIHISLLEMYQNHLQGSDFHKKLKSMFWRQPHYVWATGKPRYQGIWQCIPPGKLGKKKCSSSSMSCQ